MAEHYQKTFEVTLEVWNQRNKTFLLLLVVVGGATLLTFNPTAAQPLLVDIIAKLLSTAEKRYGELRSSFPYGLIQTIILMVILYLTLVLYHRTMFIQRAYRYLAVMETEIRSGLQLGSDAWAFTREGKFYEQHTPLLRGMVAFTYVGMLGILLIAFLGMRTWSDVIAGNFVLAAFDCLIAAPTLLFFWAYARLS